MATQYSTLMGLAEPVQGELSGTWGDTVTKGITEYLDIALAGAQTISGTQTAVTLSLTNGNAAATNIAQVGSGSTGSAQFAIINCTGSPASTLTVTVPASSRQYIVINATSTSQSVKVVGVGPTTGVTIAAGRAAHIAWNGSDFTLVATTDASKLSGILAVANGGTGLSSGTSGGVPYFSGSTTIASSAALAANALVVGGGAGVAPSTITTGTGVVTALGVNTGTAGAFVVNGGALGTPASGTLTNATGLPLSTGVTGTLAVSNGGTGVTTSTGSGSVVLSTSPALTTPNLGTPSAATLTNATGLPLSTGVTGTLPIANGGTGLTTTPANGALDIGNGTGFTRTTLTAGSGVSITNGAGSITINATGSGGTVTSVAVSGGTTGLTVSGSPITTSGTITLAGTLAAANGGTGQSSYAVGDLVYASTTTALSKLADVATGNALISGGVGVAPSYGKIGLTTHVSGTLPIANGGTGLTSFTANGVMYASGTGTLTTGSALTFDGSTLATTGALTVDGNATLGNASTDTVTVNGYMGVGGAATSSQGLSIVSTALTGAGQIGVLSSITATSAATNNARALYGKVSTAAAAFTVGNVYTIFSDDATKGAGSTITNQHGLYISDQTQGTNNYGITSLVSSGTNKWNIYASGTAANYFGGQIQLNQDYVEKTVTANTSTAYTIDLANGTVQILTLTGNCTFTFPTATAGKSFIMLLKQDATGSRTVTWPAAVKWPGGTAPTITSTASKLDKYIFTADGTNWYGSNAGQNYTV